MQTLTITPHKLGGRLAVPASKSAAHRAVICAALAQGRSELSGVGLSEDIAATAGAMRALGAQLHLSDGRMSVEGMRGGPLPAGLHIDCNESGSTLRFLIPIALARGGDVIFTGSARLLSRPLDAYFAICEQDGIACEVQEDEIHFCGRLRGGDYTLPGNVSSQYVTGLLLALPLLEADSTIHITGPLESRGYVDMTLGWLRRAGIEVHNDGYRTFRIPGGQRYAPFDVSVEGDYSQAAFFLVADALGSSVTVSGLSPDSAQGDRAILDVIRRMGGQITEDVHGVRAAAHPLHGIEIDVCQIPDLVPVLAVLAAGAQGRTALVNAGRLRIKESDRLYTTARELNALGARIEEHADSLVIEGGHPLTGGICEAHNDHRIAMALAVASTVCTGPVTISGSGCVKKSYPHFWDDFASLGGEWHEQ